MHRSPLVRVAATTMLVGFAAAPLVLAAPAAAQDPDPEPPATQQPEPESPALTWGVVPSTPDGPDGRPAYDYKLDPGAELTDYLGVSNHSTEEITVAVYASDAFTTADGGFDLLPSAEPPIAVGSWVTLDSPTLTIPGRSRVDVPFQLAVPDNATPGDHAGGLVAALTTTGTDAAGDQVLIEHRVGARIYLRVSGELAPALTIEQLDASYGGTANPVRGGSVTATYTVHNTGNVRLAATGRVEVAGPFGLGRRTLVAEPLPEILPGSALTTTVTVDRVPPLFRLTTTVDLEAGPPGSTRLWAWPWSQAVLLLVLAGGIAGWLWRRRRLKRRIAATVATQVAAALAAAGKEAAPAEAATEEPDETGETVDEPVAEPAEGRVA